MAVYTAREIYRFARLAGFSPDQAVTMTAIALAESHGNSGAHNPHGEDSRGLWQINVAAHREFDRVNLYDPLENAKAAFAVSGRGADVSMWTTTHGDNAKFLAYRTEAQAAARAAGDSGDLGVWTGTPGYGHPLPAGGGGGGGGSGGGAAGLGMAPADGNGGAHESFVQAALAQTGDRYVFGAEARLDDPNPAVFDCSELTQWAAHQAGVELPDGSWNQYLTLQQQGASLSVEEALHTRGALLFSFSSPPTGGGGRPSQAHVAISLGDGRTIEAMGTQYGVGSWSAKGRFNYAAVIPQLATSTPLGGPAQPIGFGEALGPAIDTDSDGLIDALELTLRTDATLSDTDGDAISDGYEISQLHTDPTKADTDGDNVLDSMERALGLDPTNPDSDHDGRVDGFDTSADSDLDGLSDALEALLGSNAQSIDSDGDGFTDSMEYQGRFNLADPSRNPLAESVPTPTTMARPPWVPAPADDAATGLDDLGNS
jgi:cell wall-associated NlpC family hydrolase